MFIFTLKQQHEGAALLRQQQQHSNTTGNWSSNSIKSSDLNFFMKHGVNQLYITTRYLDIYLIIITHN